MSLYKAITVDGRSVLEHRHIWEFYNGPIPRGHEVHHRNGNTFDNRIENLQLLTASVHRRMHCGWIQWNNRWFKPLCRGSRVMVHVFWDSQGRQRMNSAVRHSRRSLRQFVERDLRRVSVG